MKLIAKLLAVNPLTSTLLSGPKELKMFNTLRGNEIAMGKKKASFLKKKYTKAIEYKLQAIISIFCKNYRDLSLLDMFDESLKTVNQIQRFIFQEWKIMLK